MANRHAELERLRADTESRDSSGHAEIIGSSVAACGAGRWLATDSPVGYSAARGSAVLDWAASPTPLYGTATDSALAVASASDHADAGLTRKHCYSVLDVR